MRPREERIAEVAALLRRPSVDRHYNPLTDELDEVAASRALNIAANTLARWTASPEPKPIKASRTVNGKRWYRVADVAALLVGDA
jgi:hypothetical protein